jgi:lipopolysaccharide export system permease protein
MFVGTLSFYFARHFTRMVAAIFLLSVALIALTTLIEFFNRGLNGDAIIGLNLALLSLLRVPSIAEETLPFAVLYGSIAAFVVANRRLELVVARAAGVSAWRFLLPACFVGLLFGVAGTAAYNPLAASLLARSNQLVAEVFIDKAPVDRGARPVWLRQTGGDTESILGASASFDEGVGLSGVTAFVYETDGTFRERVDAKRAHYSPRQWLLEDATITAPSTTPRHSDTYELPTNLALTEVKRTFLQLDSVSFWTLPGLVASARRAGVPSDRYELQFNALLSRPILLLAMVLIAASVSLRFSRSRRVAPLIISGVAVGFMLYVLMKIARDLGSGGVVPPPLAAWLPAIAATLLGITVLLHLEDG